MRLPFEARATAASLVLIASLALAPRAESAIVGFDFSGTVDLFADGFGSLDGSVGIGTPFTGSLLYDTTAFDAFPADSTLGFYGGTAPPFKLEIQVGSYAFASSAIDVLVSDGRDLFGDIIDSISAVNRAAEPFPGDPLLQVQILSVVLDDRDETALSSDALPIGPLALDAFELRNVRIYGCALARTSPPGFCPNNDWDIIGRVETLTFVPEPGTALLAGLGLVALGARRRAAPRGRS